jgi:hypothetical protein
MMAQMDQVPSSKLPLEIRKPAAANEVIPRPVLPKDEVQPGVRGNSSTLAVKSKTKGAVNRQGEDSIDAVDTPSGRYGTAVKNVINLRFQALLKEQGVALEVDSLKVQFWVNQDGRATDITFIEKPAHQSTASLVLDAILSAQIPPVPRELQEQQADRRYPAEFQIQIIP